VGHLSLPPGFAPYAAVVALSKCLDDKTGALRCLSVKRSRPPTPKPLPGWAC